jgi:hypothetical protein
MPRVAGVLLIERTVEDVFDFVADERNVYDPRIVDVEKLTEGPVGVGTRFRSRSRSGRRVTTMLVELTRFDRPRRLASTTHTPSMGIHSTLTFEPVHEGTLLRWSSQLLTPRLADPAAADPRAHWSAAGREHLRCAEAHARGAGPLTIAELIGSDSRWPMIPSDVRARRPS